MDDSLRSDRLPITGYSQVESFRGRVPGKEYIKEVIIGGKAYQVEIFVSAKEEKKLERRGELQTHLDGTVERLSTLVAGWQRLGEQTTSLTLNTRTRKFQVNTPERQKADTRQANNKVSEIFRRIRRSDARIKEHEKPQQVIKTSSESQPRRRPDLPPKPLSRPPSKPLPKLPVRDLASSTASHPESADQIAPPFQTIPSEEFNLVDWKSARSAGDYIIVQSPTGDLSLYVIDSKANCLAFALEQDAATHQIRWRREGSNRPGRPLGSMTPQRFAQIIANGPFNGAASLPISERQAELAKIKEGIATYAIHLSSDEQETLAKFIQACSNIEGNKEEILCFVEANRAANWDGEDPKTRYDDSMALRRRLHEGLGFPCHPDANDVAPAVEQIAETVLAAYKWAVDNNQLADFYRNAVNPRDACIEAKQSTLAAWLVAKTLGVTPTYDAKTQDRNTILAAFYTAFEEHALRQYWEQDERLGLMRNSPLMRQGGGAITYGTSEWDSLKTLYKTDTPFLTQYLTQEKFEQFCRDQLPAAITDKEGLEIDPATLHDLLQDSFLPWLKKEVLFGQNPFLDKLSIAIMTAPVDQVVTLIKDGNLDLNTEGPEGNSPVHWMVKREPAEVLHIATALCEAGADIDALNGANRTVLDELSERFNVYPNMRNLVQLLHGMGFRNASELQQVEAQPPEEMKREFPYTPLDREHPLSQGANGTIYLALDPATQEELVIKEAKPTGYEDLRVEIETLTRLGDNPNFIRLVAADPERHLEVLERAEGSLNEANRLQSYSLGEKVELLRGLRQGITFLHDHNMTHNDINLKNLLVKKGQIKIADLGSCLDFSGADRVQKRPDEAQQALIVSGFATLGDFVVEKEDGMAQDRKDFFKACYNILTNNPNDTEIPDDFESHLTELKDRLDEDDYSQLVALLKQYKGGNYPAMGELIEILI